MRSGQTSLTGRALTALAAFLLPFPFVLGFSWPLVLHMDDTLFGGVRDHLAYVWLMQHFANFALGKADLFFDPMQYYPEGYNATAIEVTLAHTIPALPITLTLGPVAAYNVMLLLSFGLTSLAMFLWVRELTRHLLIALVVGLVSAFIPYRIQHMNGQLPQMATYWIAFLFFALERYLRTRRLAWAVTAGGCFALNGLASWYTLPLLGTVVPVYVLLRWQGSRAQVIHPRTLRHVLVGSVVALGPLLPLGIVYLRFQPQAAQTDARSFHVLTRDAVHPFQILFGPNVRHPLWGPWAMQTPLAGNMRQALFRRVAFSGYLPLAGALLGLAVSRLSRRKRALIGLSVIGFFGATGPVLMSYDAKPVLVPLPSPLFDILDRLGGVDLAERWFDRELAEQMRANSATAIPLPYALVYRLPLFSSIRYVTRHAIVLTFALLALSALGAVRALAWLRRRLRGRLRTFDLVSAMAIVVLGGFTLFEYWQHPHRFLSLAPRAVDRWLKEQPWGAVLELPLNSPVVDTQRLAIFHSMMHHHKPLALGMRGSYEPPVDAKRRQVISELPNAEAVHAVCSWGVRYIILNLDQIRDPSQVAHWRTVLEALPIQSRRLDFASHHAYVLNCPVVGSAYDR